ncbi:hypothetical protein F5Y01DRAFT_16920 [Xylaria sp. FL0043]|nr:hypothetical protein F5Y01DRAFT_16920 [Xylaria sp. FL0043]
MSKNQLLIWIFIGVIGDGSGDSINPPILLSAISVPSRRRKRKPAVTRIAHGPMLSQWIRQGLDATLRHNST